ncbi:MAG: hypothetical protein K6G89_00340 [Clostridia bacterium]|nr:hypothetical protein [Clostridia bacterium]
MPKKFLVLMLGAVLLFTLCSCGLINPVPDGNSEETGNAHVSLMAEAESLAEAASKQYDAGLTFQSEYLYGLAQAEISSLRLCVDTVLWLKGEGANLAAVIGDAPYKNWDEIVGAGLGSNVPFYFEGLLYKFQGQSAKADECFDKAGYNPLSFDYDFYYLKKMSVDKLYSIRNDAAVLEAKICKLYTPRTYLLAERTGAEFSPAYHLAMAGESGRTPAEAAQCALNALLSSPLTPYLYGYAASFELNAGKAELASEILNEGLFLAPEDATVNYVSALFSHASGDDNAAKAFLDTAKAGAEGDLLAKINDLYGQIGG